MNVHLDHKAVTRPTRMTFLACAENVTLLCTKELFQMQVIG